MNAQRPRAPRQRANGFTLIEMIVAIVVLGVGLVGVLGAFRMATRSSGDLAVRKQMIALAEDLMEEVQLKPYASTANAAPAPCARNTFNDVSDYNGYATTGQVCSLDGSPLPALSGYNVRITVAAASLGGVAATLRIDVTVSRDSDSVTLTGWRTGYAL